MAFNMIKASENKINKTMGNIDDAENNAKISDSAYTNSCSNSQARSRSSHSTHSESHSSGSSGYGGKPSTSGYSSNNVSQPPEIRCKVKKKKKQLELDTVVIHEEKQTVPDPEPEIKPIEEQRNDDASSTGVQQKDVSQVEINDLSTIDRNSSKDKTSSCNIPIQTPTKCKDGFSCVISMQDGVVIYTTNSLTNTLGFPRDMWIGRSFIDFVHPRDRNTFASQITNDVATPKILNGTPNEVNIKLSFSKGSTLSTMVCRIRQYRGLDSGFGVKNQMLSFMPFLLKLSFRNIIDEEGEVIYLLVQATPFFPAFKVPNEIISKPISFVIRHASNGDIKYIDPESVPYLGYSPQDILNMDALQLYHPHDLVYLKQVYETIVKEGGVLRSKPIRMMTQNGDYVKLETEWSSFINPWSRKLEFVIGKHLLIEGPNNPDVFQSAEKPMKFSEDDKNTAQAIRESILKVMNKILTKPAEAAKQQMTKRCQDLASFMESLMDEAPKNDEDIWVDVKEADSAYYDFSVQERDSVMLGGISPHRDYQESKSSTETQISYNQLNYNGNLQRYFDSYLPFSEYGKYGNLDSGAHQSMCDRKFYSVGQFPPMEMVDSGDMTSSCDSSVAHLSNATPVTLGNYTSIKLTESALNKHNTIMEKELMKLHREIKLAHKDERKKSSKESRLKKKEHLARCNASFLPTSARLSTVESESVGLKRSSRQSENSYIKQRCATVKLSKRHENTDDVRPSTSHKSTTIWPPMIPAVNNMNTYFLGISQQMPLVNPAVTGLVPVCYVPAVSQQMSGDGTNTRHKPNQNTIDQAYAMPCVMYAQPVYSSPLMYSAVNPNMQQMPDMQQIQHIQQMQHMHQMQQMQMQQGFMLQNYDTAAMRNAMLGLSSTNYQEACKLTFPTESKSIPTAKQKEKDGGHLIQSNNNGNGASSSSAAVSQLSTKLSESKEETGVTNSEGTIEKTDEESSYSSFYSNFFKSESGSAEEGDLKKRWTGNPHYRTSSSFDNTNDVAKTPRRKMDPPWMEQVCVTSELIYQYQMLPKNKDEVLSRDQEILQNTEQPSLVNDQLGQLYLDLQLEGVATRLTLEEGITSSSSSGEENFVRKAKVQVRRRKREYSKLVMIYEEDAPLPPPDKEASPTS
ncbi:period circadian protein isoform X3 [Pieris brassicae]|uniref:period circadian protein isoform X3 n=1 Tax=Pieris brassicae TaxID=7116 RepID=UPI001E65FA02|nr:period circadian protein isoform X3 [Pieris brassicae]